MDLTTDQLSVWLNKQDRRVVIAPRRSGKTELACLEADRWSEFGRSVLYVCAEQSHIRYVKKYNFRISYASAHQLLDNPNYYDFYIFDNLDDYKINEFLPFIYYLNKPFLALGTPKGWENRSLMRVCSSLYNAARWWSDRVFLWSIPPFISVGELKYAGWAMSEKHYRTQMLAHFV